MRAARYGRERCVEFLLVHRDIDINCKDNVSDVVDLHITVLSALFFLPLSLYLNISLIIVVSISMYQSLSISIYQLVYIHIHFPISIIYVFIIVTIVISTLIFRMDGQL